MPLSHLSLPRGGLAALAAASAVAFALVIQACTGVPFTANQTDAAGDDSTSADGGGDSLRADAVGERSTDDGSGDEAGPVPIAEISAGNYHSCALLQDGSVWCWGANQFGQLGVDTRRNAGCMVVAPDVGAVSYGCIPTPTRVVGLGKMAHLASPMGYHSCALDGDGDLWCWGANQGGQLGHVSGDDTCNDPATGTTFACSTTPTKVQGVPPIAQASAAGFTTCAVTRGTGAVWCWGDNTLDKVGNPAAQRGVPIQVVGSEMASGTSQVATSCSVDTCASKGSSVWCWGANDHGGLGQSGSASTCETLPCTPTPGQIFTGPAMALGDVASVHGGGSGNHCALRTDGTVWCWGDNDMGGLGNGTWDSADHIYAAQVPHLTATGLEVGDTTACAATVAGVYCWGGNATGEIGTGDFASTADAGVDGSTGCIGGLPCATTQQQASIPGTQGFTQTAVGFGHVMALRVDGTLWLWGYNAFGQLGHAPATALDQRCAFLPAPCNPLPAQLVGLP